MSEEKRKTAREKIEKLADEFDKNPETKELAVVLYVIAGSAMLGDEAVKSLAVWNATWADSVIKEVNKMREEDKIEEITDKIIDPKDE
tara:strand:+ start:432 stop:695 length:264 start_codon:yes stop_codon:yes gene_type:complete